MAQQQTHLPMPNSNPHKQTQLMDLDDACLLMVFKHLMPLPDLFCCAQTCWRFHQLTSDKRMWLVVAPSYIPPEDTPSGRAGVIHSSLKAAVAASRPGDTIWLAPGMPHEAWDITISHPLHILGGGLKPEDTQIIAPPGAECAITFSASCKVAMLAFSATLCPCLVHQRGLLTVERCKLSSDPRGLLHLVSPVVTLAASSSGAAGAAAATGSASCDLAGAVGVPCCSSPATTTAGAAAGGATVQGRCSSSPASVAAAAAAAAGGLLEPDPSAASIVKITASHAAVPTAAAAITASNKLAIRSVVGTGRLIIVECRLQGGSTAVRCGGTGRLKDVRVIYESRAAFFWLEVDSLDPGCQVTRQRELIMQYGQLQQQEQRQQEQQQQGQQLDVVRASKAKEWQHCRALGGHVGALQQQQEQEQDGAAAGPLSGLARIQAVLGKRVNPAMLAAHLGSRKQQTGPSV